MQIGVDLMVLEATYKYREEHCHFQRHPPVIKKFYQKNINEHSFLNVKMQFC